MSSSAPTVAGTGTGTGSKDSTTTTNDSKPITSNRDRLSPPNRQRNPPGRSQFEAAVAAATSPNNRLPRSTGFSIRGTAAAAAAAAASKQAPEDQPSQPDHDGHSSPIGDVRMPLQRGYSPQPDHTISRRLSTDRLSPERDHRDSITDRRLTAGSTSSTYLDSHPPTTSDDAHWRPGSSRDGDFRQGSSRDGDFRPSSNRAFDVSPTRSLHALPQRPQQSLDTYDSSRDRDRDRDRHRPHERQRERDYSSRSDHHRERNRDRDRDRNRRREASGDRYPSDGERDRDRHSHRGSAREAAHRDRDRDRDRHRGSDRESDRERDRDRDRDRDRNRPRHHDREETIAKTKRRHEDLDDRTRPRDRDRDRDRQRERDRDRGHRSERNGSDRYHPDRQFPDDGPSAPRSTAPGHHHDGFSNEPSSSPPRKLRRIPHETDTSKDSAEESHATSMQPLSDLRPESSSHSQRDSATDTDVHMTDAEVDQPSRDAEAGQSQDSTAKEAVAPMGPQVNVITTGPVIQRDDPQAAAPSQHSSGNASHPSPPPKPSSHSIAVPTSPLAAPPPEGPPPEEPPAPPSAPPPDPTTAPKPTMTSAERRRAIRAQLKPLRERQFIGCSDPAAYQKVDDSQGGLLGMGTFGEVSRAKHVETGEEVALKKIKIQVNESQSGMPITAIREIKLLKTLSHPNVCPAVDMVYEPPPISAPLMSSGTFYMVLPYMEHDLNGLIERLSNEDKPFTPAQIKLYMKQLFEGTLYLHQNKILHRDIKAANILISNNGNLKIADFGLARPYHDPGDSKGHPAWKMDERGQSGWHGGEVNYTGMVVTRWYRPPELLAGERKYGPAVDMWGLGCLLAEMIVRRPMFKGSSEINQLEQIVDLCGSPSEDSYPGWNQLPGVRNLDNSGQTKVDKNEKGRHDFGKRDRRVRERFLGVVRSELADLIDRLLVLDPRKRLTAEGALAHKWFDVEPLPADPGSLPQYPDSKEANKGQGGQGPQQVPTQGGGGGPPKASGPAMMGNNIPPPHAMGPGGMNRGPMMPGGGMPYYKGPPPAPRPAGVMPVGPGMGASRMSNGMRLGMNSTPGGSGVGMPSQQQQQQGPYWNGHAAGAGGVGPPRRGPPYGASGGGAGPGGMGMGRGANPMMNGQSGGGGYGHGRGYGHGPWQGGGSSGVRR